MENRTDTLDRAELETGELLPPEGHRRVGHRIFELLDEILQDKSDLGLPDKWNRNYELTRNKHWRRTTKKVTLVTANMVGNHRTRTVNMLTDNNPTFNIARIGADDIEDEDVYDKILHTAEHWWHEQEQQDVLESSVTNGEEQGISIEKVVFNPDLEYGQGEVETQLVSAFNIGFYPTDGKPDVQKKEAILHFEAKNLREVKREYPEHADEIQPDAEYIGKLGDTKKEISANSSSTGLGYLTTFSSAIKKIIDGLGLAGDPDSEDVLVVECWCKDYTRIKEVKEVEHPQTRELVQIEIEQPKYKGYIRCVKTCNAGDLVLADDDNPSINPELPLEQAMKTYLFDKYPFSASPSNKDTNSIWGISDYEQLEQLNLEVDKALSQISMIKDKASRLKIINPRDSGVADSEFTNYPGIIRPANAAVAQAIRYMDAPTVPVDLYKTVEIYKDMFFMVSGAFELERAQTPGREVIAYKAIAALLERASTMLKGKIRNYSKMCRIRGRMYVSHVQNWYDTARWITYEENGEDVPLQVVGTDMIFPAQITVVSGSTMPRAQVQEREEALALKQMGSIDNEELLKKLDWPDRKNVIRRLNAGPIGMFLEKLAAIGTPDELLQYFKELSEIDDKKLEKAVKGGDVPSFEMVLKSILEGKPMEPELSPIEMAEINQKQAELKIDAEKAKAEIDKIYVEIDLTREKIISERVDQRVRYEGLGFDKQKLDMMRAELVRDMSIKSAETKIKAEEVKAKAKQQGQGPFNERGLKSNNKE